VRLTAPPGTIDDQQRVRADLDRLRTLIGKTAAT
jgi:hypothetical protein